MNISGFQSSLQGIHSGFQGLRNNAQEIASSTIEDSPLRKESTESIVGMISNSHHVEANVKTLKAQDEMLGTLIDELA